MILRVKSDAVKFWHHVRDAALQGRRIRVLRKDAKMARVETWNFSSPTINRMKTYGKCGEFPRLILESVNYVHPGERRTDTAPWNFLSMEQLVTDQ